MAHTTRRLAATLAALALVLGGCGDDAGDDGGDDDGAVPSATDPPTGTDGGDTGDGAGERLDPCSLLTTDEVEAAFGVPVAVEPDEALSTDVQQVCNWRSEDLVVSVQVIVIDPGPQADLDRQREQTEELFDDPDATEDLEVPGAERAFSVDGIVIAMQLDEHYVQVGNLSIGEHSNPAVTLELAELVAGRG